MMKYLLTGLVIIGLLLTIISKIGSFFGLKQRSFAGMVKAGLVFAVIILVGALCWYLWGQQDRDFSIVVGPFILFLMSLDIYVRQRKEKKGKA
jgi:hypothetical protein